MSASSASQEDHVFLAKMDNVHNLVAVLKAVNFKEVATVVITENGMKFTVEDAKSAQAIAYVQSELFREYSLQQQEQDGSTAMFRVNLPVLMECLQIFGTSSSSPEQPAPAMRMCYSGHGSPLTLLLEEGGVITDCSITTMVADEVLDFDFSSAKVVSKIIMRSECLKEAFTDVDVSSEVMEFCISHKEPQLRISTYGQAGSTHIDFPNTPDVMETFECQMEHTNKYRLNLLKSSVKALNQSSKLSIRTDDRGFLSLQYLVKTEDGKVCFVDYLVTIATSQTQ